MKFNSTMKTMYFVRFGITLSYITYNHTKCCLFPNSWMLKPGSKHYFDPSRWNSVVHFVLYTFQFIRITHNANKAEIRNSNNALLTYFIYIKSLSLFLDLLASDQFIIFWIKCAHVYSHSFYLLNESSLLVKVYNV